MIQSRVVKFSRQEAEIFYKEHKGDDQVMMISICEDYDGEEDDIAGEDAIFCLSFSFISVLYDCCFSCHYYTVSGKIKWNLHQSLTSNSLPIKLAIVW